MSTGVHYGAVSCEGCKGFFKRCLLKNETLRCYLGSMCEITVEDRNKCKACRFNRCIAAGMTPQAIKTVSNSYNKILSRQESSNFQDNLFGNLKSIFI